MDPIQLMLMVHKQMTINDPICYNKIDITNCKELPESNEELQEIFSRACSNFSELGLPNGSVHEDPSFWMNMFLNVYEDRQKDTTTIEIANGCCNNDKCPIKRFYEAIADTLRT